MTQNTQKSYFFAGYSIFQYLGAVDCHDMGDPRIGFDLVLSLRDLEAGQEGFNIFTDEGAKQAAEAMKRNHPEESQRINKALEIQLKWNAQHQQEEER